MKIYPLKRIKLSNEYMMTYVFMVLVMYQIPWWFKHPGDIAGFVIAFIASVMIDTIIGLKRNHVIKCSVSAAVTMGIVYVIFPSIPIWGGLLAVVVAMAGKHLLGGTGKNSLNPAMIGVLVLALIFKNGHHMFYYDHMMLLIIILSLPLMIIRPYASIGWISGMIVSLYIAGDLNLMSLTSTGVFFWGCMVITDPVTINHRSIMGIVLFILGFVSASFNVLQMSVMILSINVISLLIENVIASKDINRKIKTNIKSPYRKVIPFEELTPHDELSESEFTSDIILNKIKEHHVVGLGGAAFPTYQKVQATMNAYVKEKYLLVNAVECDPGLVHDAWIVRRFNLEITKSLQLLGVCIPELKVVIATKSLENLDYPENIMIKKVPDIYPIGAEAQLIKYVLNKEWSSDTIPAKQGVLVLNIQTLLSIYDAVVLNKKASSKYITIGNLISAEAQIVKVTLGKKISDVLKEGYTKGALFTGGGMMQARQVVLDDVIDTTTNFIAISNIPRYKEGICSKCGLCVLKCPSGLEVSKIVELVNHSKRDKVMDYHPERCISCGICSYYCLAGKNLSMQVRIAGDWS